MSLLPAAVTTTTTILTKIFSKFQLATLRGQTTLGAQWQGGKHGESSSMEKKSFQKAFGGIGGFDGRGGVGYGRGNKRASLPEI
jgi:hypothetical protein